MKTTYTLILLGLCALLLGGCVNLSPKYARPGFEEPIPDQYKEEEGWHTGVPRADIDRGSWWTIFNDPTLNELMPKLNASNQNIAIAAANLRQARTQINMAQSAFLPTLTGPASLTRSGTEGSGPGTRYSAGVSSQWEISFWNALPGYEAALAETEASAGDYATMRLAAQAELAQTFFQLRAYDSQLALYESTIKAYKRAVGLTSSQYRGGIATSADVAQAETQLATAEAQYAGVQRQRALLEHAIAVLTGQLPSGFSLERGKLVADIPVVPSGLPSALLERRPDIAAAERRVASANQQIGFARAAWFPTLNIGADFLFQGTSWLTSPLHTWSVGPSAALSLFEGGRKLAENEAAWAKYEADVASYKQNVLQAFKEVEDNIAALRYLEKEAKAQQRAVRASREALRLSTSQYSGGMTTYLQVVTSQTNALSSERNAIEVHSQRLVAAVNLIKALGGGWQQSDLQNLVKGTAPEVPAGKMRW